MQTLETLVKTYSIEELNARYPTKPWIVSFDINTYNFTPNGKGKKSKLTNGFMLNPFGKHPLEEHLEEKPIEPPRAKSHAAKKKPTYIKKVKKKEVVTMTEKKIPETLVKKLLEKFEATKIRKKAWDDANRDKINARRRERAAEKKNGFVKKNLSDYPPKSPHVKYFEAELDKLESISDRIFTKESSERIVEFRYFNDIIPIKLTIYSHLLENGHSEEKLQKIIDAIKDYMGGADAK